MSDQFSPIRPKQVPLSHAETVPQPATDHGASLITWGLGVALAVGLLVLVFFVVPGWLETARQAPAGVAATQGPGPSASQNTTAAPSQPSSAPAGAAGGEDDQALPPYQQLQREQARKKAQDELAAFVELQIELEKNMKVGEWGQAAYDEAKDLAAAGDEQFVKEQFEKSIDSYQAATASLRALMERGRSVLETSLAQGAAALEARDHAAAEKAFAMAANIAPQDPRVTRGQARAELLPRINELMRQGRNQELAGKWSAAADTYQQVAALDPATAGLEAAQDRVAQGQREKQVQETLSTAFAHLDAERFEAARRAFHQVLDIDAGNTVALGGLEQVAKDADLARIRSLKSRADQAAADERWEDAAELYGQVLEVDPTIQFAQTGRAKAREQQRTRAALDKIVQSPDRLSSDKLYREAQNILAQAETLEPRGRKLAARIQDVRSILETYANPVPVVLRSDNRTEVTLSTVGRLGSFEEKRLELRPGSYTVIGSRDGCRDVREQIVVRPNMNPVDIRCVEAL